MQPNSTISRTHEDLAGLIPPPNAVRLAIAAKSAEMAVLRRLLKAAETKARLLHNVQQGEVSRAD